MLVLGLWRPRYALLLWSWQSFGGEDVLNAAKVEEKVRATSIVGNRRIYLLLMGVAKFILSL